MRIRQSTNLNSWTIELRPATMDAETYYDPPKYSYEVMMPEEFLDSDLFMRINTGDL